MYFVHLSKSHVFIGIIVSVCCLALTGVNQDMLWAQETPAGVVPDPDVPGLGNKVERLEWLQDVGFGMYTHWSMDSQIGSVISHGMVGASENYLKWFVHELPKTFNPKRYDAEKIVILAKAVRYEIYRPGGEASQWFLFVGYEDD